VARYLSYVDKDVEHEVCKGRRIARSCQSCEREQELSENDVRSYF
jgi:hypothetical protein